jgi:arylsulfatase A-like enzyme
MKKLVLPAVLLHTMLLFGCSEQKSEQKDANILFILVDDLGYNDLGFMGSPFYETPNIDKLASKGMTFTNGYACSGVCSPSRASIMTGKYTANHGITDWIGAREGADWRKVKRHTKLLPSAYIHNLPKGYETMPETLKEAGYKTFFAGKWHLGSTKDISLPTDHGFDINKGGFHRGSPANGRYFSPFGNPFLKDYPEEKGMSLSTRLANETVSFIEENKDTTFLAYLSFYAVHGPIQTTQEKWGKYRTKVESMGIAEEGFEMERVLPIRKYQDNPVYAGLVEQVDDAVGIVLAKLEELNLSDKTIIVFTSDNGGVASGDNFSTSIAPLRGGKGYQWEGGFKVPYLISVPWMNHNGMKNNTPVTGADFYPTLLDLLRIENNQFESMDGQSLLPLLNGESLASRPLYWHYPHYGNQGGEPNSVIQEERWKLIHYWEDGRNELYNLESDISEQNDLTSAHPDKAEAMLAKLEIWLSEMNAAIPEIDPQQSKDSARMVLNRYQSKLWPQLEMERKNMLKEAWQPGDDWWGSKLD